jgi:signal transduction histidine kinase
VGSTRGLAEVVKVLLDLRLAALAVLAVTEALAGTSLPSLAALVVVVPLSFLPLRWWDRLGVRMTTSAWFTVLDTAASMLVLVLFGVGSTALVYVGASLALLGATRLSGALLAFGAVTALHVLAVWEVVADGDEVAGRVGGMVGRLMLLGACVVLGARLGRLLVSRDQLYRRVHASELSRAHAEERTRLAQEMHDSLSKTLHGLHLLATTLTRRLEQDGSTRTADARAIMTATELARNDSRRLLSDLRSAPPEALTQGLRELALAWGTQHPGVRLDVQVPDHELDLGPGARYEVVRSVGEVLENVARHAAATRVCLRADQDDGWVRVEISDDGRGMPPPDLARLHAAGHYGLVGVHERMRRVNGDSEVRSTPGRGTTVRLRLPAGLTASSDAPARTAPVSGSVSTAGGTGSHAGPGR